MELFSSPGDISIRLDGDRHTRGDAISTPMFIARYMHYISPSLVCNATVL